MEKLLNTIAIVLILMALLIVMVYVIVDNTIGGNVLNCQQIENEYLIANKDGEIKKVSKETWLLSYTLTIILFIFVVLGTMAVFYLFVRYYVFSNILRIVSVLKQILH